MKRTPKIASNKTADTLLEEQEEILAELQQAIEKPFKNEWEYYKWQRQAAALQLSYHVYNSFTLENRAIWENLLEGNATEEKRKWIARILTLHLYKTYAYARQELVERESKDDPYQK